MGATPLENEHAAFVVGQAHCARTVIGVRGLDTGVARDVSGVLRVTIGDNAVESTQDLQRGVEEKELLYFVGGDGGVRVFERGQ